MKKVLSLAGLLGIIFIVVACGGNNNTDRNNTNGGTAVSNNSSDVRIKLTFNNGEVIVKMVDNPTSRDFRALLPLTTTFEDYAGTEKISRLAKRLTTENAPSGIDPSGGDFNYYSPWGNLAIFYKDSGYANGLIKLGTIESGIEKLASMNGNFTVTIEKMD